MYGYDTHSWRNSTEKRQMDKERREATKAYVPGPMVDVQPLCNCLDFTFSHDPVRHPSFESDTYTARYYQRHAAALRKAEQE